MLEIYFPLSFSTHTNKEKEENEDDKNYKCVILFFVIPFLLGFYTIAFDFRIHPLQCNCSITLLHNVNEIILAK